MSNDLNSLYNPLSREFGEYVIVFQVFEVYVCYRFLVSMLSFFKECSNFQYSTALPLLLFTFMNFDHTSYQNCPTTTLGIDNSNINVDPPWTFLKRDWLL